MQSRTIRRGSKLGYALYPGLFGEVLRSKTSVKLGNASVKLVTEEFFLNNEKHETTRKNFMEAALTAGMRRTSHEIFSGHFVSFVVKKIPVSPSFTDALHSELFAGTTVTRKQDFMNHTCFLNKKFLKPDAQIFELECFSHF